ncbi:hypothetical protein RhiirA4_469261 [Rhizophagus irregularis]|uniref:Uncharacterized protein n=1 Tax=Rhizophagus irregularis TaxID=588596 RepID=A0A2I1GZ65_9GLOM|nr:hypothetical protein RhiirA4_469261 [Rhizophagus irregularis]
MENIHTIWDSSTVLRDISQAQKLEIAIDNGLLLFEKCEKLRNTCNKLVNENEQLRNKLEQSTISSKRLDKETLELQNCEVELSSKTFDLQTLKTECGVFK